MLEAAKTGPVTLEVASCARPAPTPRQRPRPSGPSGKHPPHRGGGKSRLSYPEARSLELDGSRRGPFCRALALLQGVKRARCPCPGAGGRRRCRTHIYSGSPCRRSTCRASLLLPPTGVPSDPSATATRPPEEGHALSAQLLPTSHRFCCQRLRDQLVLRERSWSRIPAETRFTCRRRSPSAPLLRCVPAAPPGAETAAVAAIV